MVVSSALVSYAGATSTISAPMKLTPSRPRRMVRSSRVDQPPVSGVPVAGATVGFNFPALSVLICVCLLHVTTEWTYKPDQECQYQWRDTQD
jgi:hypothetical protein